MKKLQALALVLVLALVGGCGIIPTTTQHPAFAMNPGWCAVMGGGIAQALSASVPIANAVVAGTAAACTAEGSVVAGPPAQVTTTTVTQAGTTKAIP